MDDDNLNTLKSIIAASRSAFEDRFDRAIAPLMDVTARFGLVVPKEHVFRLRKRLHDDTFKLLVIGHFNTGKSTLLNAILASAHSEEFAGSPGLLPMDSLPSSPVLTVLRYGERLTITAHSVDGTMEEWTLEDYQREARLYAELDGDALPGDTPGSRLERVGHFEITARLEILRAGLEIVDTPGLSEHPLRETITRNALSTADAVIFMFRSDMPAGTDEIEALTQVLAETGYCKVMVNLFPGAPYSPRLDKVFVQRLREVRELPHGDKLAGSIAYVNSKSALRARLDGDADALAASGQLALEADVGELLTREAYKAKKRAAVSGTRDKLVQIREEVQFIGIAAQAASEEVMAKLDVCDERMAEIDARLAKVQAIVEGLRVAARLETHRSFQARMRQIGISLEGRFAEVKIESLQTTLDKLKALVLSNASKEAVNHLNRIVAEELDDWASAPSDQPGLLQDLSDTLEGNRRVLQAELEQIETELRDIRVQLRALAPPEVTPEGAVGTADRVLTAGLGLITLGPVGAALAVGGWRGIVGMVVATAGAKLGLVLAASVLGIAVAPAVITAILLVAATGGPLAAALYKVERRIRANVLEAYKPALAAFAQDEKVVGEILAAVDRALAEECDNDLATLGAALGEQREGLAKMRAVCAASAEEKAAICADVARAEAELAAADATFAGMAGEIDAHDAPTIAA